MCFEYISALSLTSSAMNLRQQDKSFVPLILEHSRKGGTAVVIIHYVSVISFLACKAVDSFHCSALTGRGTILAGPNRLGLSRFLSQSRCWGCCASENCTTDC